MKYPILKVTGASGALWLSLAGSAAAQEACSSAPMQDTPYECLCAGGDTSGSVWGSNPYTADSDVCTAATHAGVNGPNGGVVRVVPTAGQDSYDGSEANGVATRDWGSYGTSFMFEAKSTMAGDALAACEAFPVGEAEYACSCGPYDGTGSVWGSGPYTADSSICVAAIHAGAIGPDGGNVLAMAADGMDSYEASTANGVETRAWGSYGSSFTINPKGPRMTMASDPSVAACSGFPSGAESVTCSCTGAEDGAVWGSSPYTADSDICAAARHAAILDGSGGVVTAIGLRGLDSYLGSEFGGVVSRDWGSYSESFVFNWN